MNFASLQLKANNVIRNFFQFLIEKYNFCFHGARSVAESDDIYYFTAKGFVTIVTMGFIFLM